MSRVMRTVALQFYILVKLGGLIRAHYAALCEGRVASFYFKGGGVGLTDLLDCMHARYGDQCGIHLAFPCGGASNLSPIFR